MDEAVHDLQLGGLNLIGRVPQGEDYRITTQGDEASWGNPVSVTRTIKGLLQDGARVALESWDNREAFLRITVEGDTAAGLAAGEAALMAELGKRNTLTWTPPQGFGPPTVFEVAWSEMDHEFVDVHELLGRRTYGVRLTLAPFARSVEETVVEAVTGSDEPVVETVLDDGSDATDWSGTVAGEPATVEQGDGAVTVRVEPASVNEILNPIAGNPSGGISGGGISTWARSSSASMGVYARKDPSGDPVIAMDHMDQPGADDLVTTYYVPIPADRTYSLLFRARTSRPNDPETRMTARLHFFDSTGARLPFFHSLDTGPLTSTYTWYHRAATAPSGAVSARLRFRQQAQYPSTTHHLGPVGLFFGTTSPDAYFDGNTPPADGFAHRWEGRVQASRSLKVPVGPVELTRGNLTADFSDEGYLLVAFPGRSLPTLYRPTVRAFATTGAGVTELERASNVIYSTRWQAAFVCQSPDVAAITVRVGREGEPAPLETSISEIRASTSDRLSFPTPRQQAGTLQVGGSVRTQGSIEVQAEGPLGSVLVYTRPEDGSGYTPPITSRWYSGGTITPDDTTVSGKIISLAAGQTPSLDVSTRFDLPHRTITPGAYALVGRIRGTLAQPILSRGEALGGLRLGPYAYARPDLDATKWQVHQLGVHHLPFVPFHDREGDPEHSAVRITVGVTPNSTDSLDIDELWLFNLADGSLTWVECPHRHLWIDTPSIESPLPQLWCGDDRDRGDARAAHDVQSWGRHEFPPGPLSVFAASTGALNPRVSLAHYKRWHTHAVE